jgi:hypothetical protein
MFGEQASPQPIFFVLAVMSAVFTIGYFWGNRYNKKLFLALYDELIEVINPDNQEYGNIGGTGEYYVDFRLKKESPLDRIEAKFTFLPRHILPYLPIAMLIDKYDKLLIALHVNKKLRDEGHIIEASYAKSGKVKIADMEQLNRTNAKWGKHDYYVYWKSKKTYAKFKELIGTMSDPGGIRHIAFIPDQKKCFIFIVPLKGHLVKDLAPIYGGILALCRKPGADQSVDTNSLIEE